MQPPAAAIEELAAAQSWLRITELLPNAPQSGVDTEYEWVEITNLGTAAASTEGMLLRDNRAETVIDAVVLGPGGSLVVAGALADTGSAAVVQRVPAIGNGLANSGDRLALVAADGSVVDALSYGSDTTYADPEQPIVAPRPGHSIERRFATDGTLVEVAHLEIPTPGVAVILPAGAADHDPPGEVAAETGFNAPGAEDAPDEHLTPIEESPVHGSMWAVLILLAVGTVGGVVAQRVVSVMRERPAPEAAATTDGTEE
jgi:hypothetical protein